jgi:hypothetical protein
MLHFILSLTFILLTFVYVKFNLMILLNVRIRLFNEAEILDFFSLFWIRFHYQE